MFPPTLPSPTLGGGDKGEDLCKWKTKPTDRFVLKWIKVNLSARITPRLAGVPWVRPWMVTVSSAGLGTLAGVVFALGWAWAAGLMAAAAQVLDGVDGQLARLTGRVSRHGAFLDSVLDRYADGAMVIGMILYLVRLPPPWPTWTILLVGAIALIGSNLVSYSSARAESLGLQTGPPTLASKGTRTSVMILCALGTVVWPTLPLVGLVYLAVHPNLAVANRILRASEGRGGLG